MKKYVLGMVAVSALAVTACQMTPKMDDADYWQRKSATSSLYLRGPKAQQTLHMDIATCTNEISELNRMDALRHAIPADTQNGKVPDPNSADGKLRQWETPKRDGALYAEQFAYTDFEGCMDYKGWERVTNLPFEQAKTARDDYMKSVYGEEYQSRHPNTKPVDGNANGYATSSPNTAVND